jgi:GNAT superfamily N-acetyltransferase
LRAKKLNCIPLEPAFPREENTYYYKKRKKGPRTLKVTLKQDRDPDIDFYYDQQFQIYQKDYLIWDRKTWEEVFNTCDVYHIEVDTRCAGDVILEDKGRGSKTIVDFSILPGYQGRGIGKEALEMVKKMGRRLTAITRKETIEFFLKSGFILKRMIRDYYSPGVDGYYITFSSAVTP